MPENITPENLDKIFAETVASQIGDDRNHGWGAKDSMAVVDAIVAADASNEIGRLMAAGKEPTLYSLSEKASALIANVINPSAFRQKLETSKRKNGETWLAKAEKGAKTASVVGDYLASL